MSNPNDYTVGWICAISTEYVAAQAFLDEEHKGPDHVATNDNNHYTLGRIGKHNVVIAVLPYGEYGLSSAATVGRDMLHSFPKVRIGLMVGIAGGTPSSKHDIRLGDIVVSASGHGKPAVLQYDFGKAIQGKPFQQTGFLNQPPPILRAAVHGLMAEYESKGHKISKAIDEAIAKNARLRKKYMRPNADTDRLYLPSVLHPENEDDDATCAVTCPNEPSKLQPRSSRTEDDDVPAIHYGLIASSNQLIKDAIIRDALAADKGILCFEMESAGLMNHFPCLVVRGICDYSDTHKNKKWQGYAAMAAAAYTKDLLHHLHPDKVEAQKKISEVLNG
jgi:nucleoside phosphorylase